MTHSLHNPKILFRYFETPSFTWTKLAAILRFHPRLEGLRQSNMMQQTCLPRWCMEIAGEHAEYATVHRFQKMRNVSMSSIDWSLYQRDQSHILFNQNCYWRAFMIPHPRLWCTLVTWHVVTLPRRFGHWSQSRAYRSPPHSPTTSRSALDIRFVRMLKDQVWSMYIL